MKKQEVIDIDFMINRFLYIAQFYSFICGYPIYGIFCLISIFIPALKKYKVKFQKENSSIAYVIIDCVGVAGLSVILLFFESFGESVSIQFYLVNNWQNFISFVLSWLALGYLGLYGLYEFKFKKIV